MANAWIPHEYPSKDPWSFLRRLNSGAGGRESLWFLLTTKVKCSGCERSKECARIKEVGCMKNECTYVGHVSTDGKLVSIAKNDLKGGGLAPLPHQYSQGKPSVVNHSSPVSNHLKLGATPSSLTLKTILLMMVLF